MGGYGVPRDSVCTSHNSVIRCYIRRHVVCRGSQLWLAGWLSGMWVVGVSSLVERGGWECEGFYYQY